MNEIIPILGMCLLFAVAGWRLRVWSYHQRLKRGYRILRGMNALDEFGGLAGITMTRLADRFEARGINIDGTTLAFELPWLERCGNVSHWKKDGMTYWKLTDRGEALCDFPY